MKYNRFFILILLLLPVFFSSANAAEDLDYVYNINNVNDISRPCFNSGGWNGWCSNESKCQLTIFNSDNKIIILGANMTNQVSTHNYTLPRLNRTGIYKADMACMEPNNLTGYDTFFFGVNNAGSDYNKNGSVVFILGILIGLIVLFSLCAFFLNEWLRMAFLLLAVLMIPVTLWVSHDIAVNSFMGEAVTNIIFTGFLVSLTGFVAMVLYVLIILTSQLKIRDNTIESKGSPLYWRKKQDYKNKHQGREYD